MKNHIFDDLDLKLKEFIKDNSKTPRKVILDLYTYLELKDELGVGEMSDIEFWSGFKIVVDANTNEERTIEFI